MTERVCYFQERIFEDSPQHFLKMGLRLDYTFIHSHTHTHTHTQNRWYNTILCLVLEEGKQVEAEAETRGKMAFHRTTITKCL